MKRISAVLLVLVGALTPAGAGLIFSDAFNYADGTLVTASNSSWTTYSGAGSQINVVAGRIFLVKNNSEDVAAPLVGAPYTPAGGTILYASFTLSVSNLPTMGGDYFATFKAGGVSGQQGRVFVGKTAAGSPTYRIGIANGSASPSVTLTNEFSTNVNYTVVLRYVVSNATSTLWVDPSLETDTSVTAGDVQGTTTVTNFAFREPSSTATGNLFLDNVRVGTAFSDVVTNAPQPPAAPSTFGTLSLLSYNLNGNGKTDWSTNAAQVQAIGRELMYLNPDIVAFNEIPYTNTYQMANWIKSFLPGYYLATNSGTDGFIRNGIASRYPITRSTSWLDGAPLDPFGYVGANFTRDLFEAQITVPGFSLPLHVFVTHLKSTSIDPLHYQDDANKRAAEGSAISNFFATVYLPGTNGTHPYVLCGDMNEDILRPATNQYVTGEPIQRMLGASTGLRLTTPVNPLTGSELTESIRLPLELRFDYILPSGLMYSNIVASQVFRSDTFYPQPVGLFADDSKSGSDHLPVIMYFNSPYAFRLLSLTRSNLAVSLTWESISNRQYRVDASSNLTVWSTLATNLTATSNRLTLNTNVTGNERYFRVVRSP